MNGIVRLNNVDHHDLRVRVSHGAAHGDAVNQMRVFPTEFEAAQREFPILFRRDEQGGFHAVVLLGLDRDENLFLDGDRWTTRYIPAIQRRGPFRSAADSDELHIDLSDPRVGGEGEPLYMRHGGNAPYLRHVGAALDVMRRGKALAEPMFAAFLRRDLIQPVELDIAVAEGESYLVPDVYTLSRDRLLRLPDDALGELNRDGHLPLAWFAAASLGNIERLIELKRAKRP